MAAGKTVEVLILGNASSAIHEVERLAGASATATKTAGDKFAAFGKTVALVTGAAGLAVAGFSLKMADDFEKSHARLENAIVNIKSSMAAWQPGIDAVQSKLEKWGFTNADVQNSLSRLVPVTKSQTEALNLQSLAADVARARHLDLESATALLVKVQTGHVALLGRLGINTKDLTGKTIDQATAIQRLTDMYGGAAQRNAETFGGKMEVLKAQASDLGVKIGQFLIPILEKLMSAVSDTIDWFKKHQDIAVALGVTIGTVLVLAIAAWIKQMVIATAMNIVHFFTQWGVAAAATSVTVDAQTGSVAALTAALEANTVALGGQTAAELAAAGGADAATASAGALELASVGAGVGAVGLGAALLGVGAAVVTAAGGWFLYNKLTATDSAGAKAHIDEINALKTAVAGLSTQLLTGGGTANWFVSSFLKLPGEKALPKALMDLGVTIQDVNNAAAFGPATFMKWFLSLENGLKPGTKDMIALQNAADDLYSSFTKAAQGATNVALFLGQTDTALQGLDAQIQTIDMTGYTDGVKGAAGQLNTFGSQARAAAKEVANQTGNQSAGILIMLSYEQRLIAQANAFGITGQKAKDLADKILGIPTDRQVRITADTAAAEAAIGRFVYGVDVALNNIHWSIPQPGNAPLGTPTVKGSIGGFHLAEGGFVPGPIGVPVVGTAHGGELVLNQRQQSAMFGGGTTIIVNVGGSVVAERRLVDAVAEGLRRKTRVSGNQF